LSGADLFTGLVQVCAKVLRLTPAADGARLSLEVPAQWRLEAGESVAVNGCCLTVLAGNGADFDLSPETLVRSSLGRLKPGSRVNLERALRVGDAMGGHFMAGHVDGLAVLVGIGKQGEGAQWRVRAPAALSRFVASKGSVALDGVSLTPFDVARDEFSVALIPHTLTATNLGERAVGDELNFEADLLARYVERLAEARQE
jgi:riboflavin synthase